MNKAKINRIVIGFLLLSNLLLLGYIFWKKPALPEGPKKIIIERLHLDEQQKNIYGLLVENHRNSIRQSEDSIITLKNRLYSTLKTTSDTTEKDKIIGAIVEIQKKIESMHYEHFNAIKSLCRPEQYGDFDDLCDEITNLFPQRGKKVPK